MKKIFTLILVFACSCYAKAQFASFDWSIRTGTQSTAKKMLIDASGNSYVWVTALAPITIGTSTYTNTAYDNYLAKYNSSGTIIWSKEIKIRMFNMCLSKDSADVLICGLLNSAYVNYDLGNGINTGLTYNSAGIIFKINGTNGNSVWVKPYDATLPTLSNSIKIDAIYETNSGIFCVQGLKMRRLNFDGSEIWNKIITANGTTYTLANATYNSWADDDGNTFFMGYSNNSNTTTVSLNSIAYTTVSNQLRTQFSLDSNGNTNWFYTNMNFVPKTALEVTKNGYVLMAGDYVYYNDFTNSNHPFIPNYCNLKYNIFKGVLKTAKPVYSAYSFVQDKAHLAADGNLYILATKQKAGVDYFVGTTTRNHTTIANTNYLYVLRINNAGVPDSVFTISTLATTSASGVVNFYKTNQGKFMLQFNRASAALTFANGNANSNTTAIMYQGLLQFTPPALPQRHTTNWTGAIDGNWFTATNWSNGIPTDTSNVVFEVGAVNYPTTNNMYYNTSTASWAKCGYLKVNAGVTMLLGVGVLVNGLLHNNGNLTYFYNVSGGGGNYSMWSNNTSYGYIIGNGSITINTVDGMYYNLYRTGANSININLFNATDNIYFTDCHAAQSINLAKGLLDFSQTTTPIFYVDSGIQYTGSARFLNATITQKVQPNIAAYFPIGDASNIQPAIVTIQNAINENYLTANFSNTVTGAAPNPATCIVNSQGIATTLNAGMWTITAASPLTTGANYAATFKLKGSTNATTANKYALLKRNNATSNWSVAGNYVAANDSASYSISSATNITSFSDFAIGIASAVLPNKNLYLSIQKNNNNYYLNWLNKDDDVEIFEIEKSYDGTVFYKLNTLNKNENNYTDALINNNNSKNYYRIKAINKQGNFYYSNMVWAGNFNQNVKIYPTVFNASLAVQNNLDKATFQLYNALGIMVMQQQINKGTTVINTNHLTLGYYLYNIVLANNVYHQGKIIKL